MFGGMGWDRATNDEIDEALDRFSGLESAALARVCELIGVVDTRQSWMAYGARSLTDWVAVRLRIRHGMVVRLAGVSRRLVDLPLLAEHFAAGGLSMDQVDAISRIATPATEEELIAKAKGLTNGALERMARRERGVGEDEAKSLWARRRLVRQWNLDESELDFHGRLPGDAGRIFDQAIESRVDEMGPNPETGMFDLYQTRSADALTELAATDGGGDGSPSHVSIFADLQALTTTDAGTAFLDNTAPIPNTTAQRLACDAVVESIIKDGRQVVGVGRRSRKIPGWLRRLVIERDGGVCQHPGCRNARWLQVHHIVPWADGGATDLDNLILLCGFHHRYVHEHDWHITGPPESRVFRQPDWTPYPTPRPALDTRLAQLVST